MLVGFKVLRSILLQGAIRIQLGFKTFCLLRHCLSTKTPEFATHRVAMASRVPPLKFSQYLTQDQSPLFGKLPPEIRHPIFEFTLADYEDPKQPYPFDSEYYRPGHTCRLVSDCSLLLTCRRIYAEARLLPLPLATFTFWNVDRKWDKDVQGIFHCTFYDKRP